MLLSVDLFIQIKETNRNMHAEGEYCQRKRWKEAGSKDDMRNICSKRDERRIYCGDMKRS